MNRKKIFDRKKIFATMLFNREIGISQDADYWKLRFKIDFGSTIAEQSIHRNSRLLYQAYYLYYEFLKSVIIQLESIRPQDIMEFLADKNIGNGVIQKELLEMLLLKPGVLEACCYIDAVDSSALSVAAALPNKQCYELIKAKFLPDHNNLLQLLLTRKDGMGKTPLDYFSSPNEATPSTHETDKPEASDLYKDAFNGNFDSLASAIRSLGNTAKETCLKVRGPQNCGMLHAIALSGSMKCLNLILKTMGKDIIKLYYKDSHAYTPAHCAATYGSPDFFLTILKLSPCLQEELIEKDGKPSLLVDAVMMSEDIEKIQIILDIMKHDIKRIENWYTSDPDGINCILFSHNFSAVNFFLLQQSITFNKDSEFVKKFMASQNYHHFPFSMYHSITMYLSKLEIVPRNLI